MRVIRPCLALVCSIALLISPAGGQDVARVVAQARTLREQGEFRKAERLLSSVLERKTAQPTDEERRQVAFDLDLLARIRREFFLTREELQRRLNQSLRDFSEAEFERWLREGRFESRLIDGVERFANRSVSNCYWRDPEWESRRREPRGPKPYFRSLLANLRSIKRAARGEGGPCVLPQRFRIRMTVTAAEDAALAGRAVRAWLPVPRDYPYQRGIHLLASQPSAVAMADGASPIRSVCLEQVAQADQPTVFEIRYEFTRWGVWFDLDADEAQPCDPADRTLTQFMRAGPHVVFTDRIKRLAAEMTDGEANPLRKARAIYDWVAQSLHYSFALEYSTIPNLSEYALTRRYGDCGQQALLFVKLCRQQGIPARWQSGWFLFPGARNLHDWAEIYIRPWGWIPVDVNFGNAALRYAEGLSPDERQEMCEF